MHHAQEWQFDGLVGPTHNYAGLAFGNVASASNAGAPSNPRAAALQGLEKMKFVRDLGIRQAFLPPHYRPQLSALQALGFSGSPAEIVNSAADYSRALLASAFSSSFMWTANAATVTPSADSGDGRVHFTPANMTSHYHRAIESEFTTQLLRIIFHNTKHFAVHNALPPFPGFHDEGAANHMISCDNHGLSGTHFFVYGESHRNHLKPTKFIARQQRMASEAIARRHGINANKQIYLHQSPQAIDQGVFHHDVIGMSTTRKIISHAEAFTEDSRELLKTALSDTTSVTYREISAEELTVAEAVATYFFNAQLLDAGDNRSVLVAPSECANHSRTQSLIARLLDEGHLAAVHYLDVRESMRNGGGPACLRLRVVLTDEEAASIHPGIILTDEKYHQLKHWITTHYRDSLHPDDLRDPSLLSELEAAYLSLEPILGMPGLYAKRMQT